MIYGGLLEDSHSRYTCYGKRHSQKNYKQPAHRKPLYHFELTTRRQVRYLLATVESNSLNQKFNKTNSVKLLQKLIFKNQQTLIS